MKSDKPTELQILVLSRLSKYDYPVLANSMELDMPALKVGKELSNLEKRGFAQSEFYMNSKLWNITQQGREYLLSIGVQNEDTHQDMIEDVVLTSANPIFFIVTDTQLAHIVSEKIGELISQDILQLNNTIAGLQSTVIDYKRAYDAAMNQRDELLKKVTSLENKLSIMSRVIQED